MTDRSEGQAAEAAASESSDPRYLEAGGRPMKRKPWTLERAARLEFEAVATPEDFPSREEWLKRATASYGALWLAHVFYGKRPSELGAAYAEAPEAFANVAEVIGGELAMYRRQVAFLEGGQLRLLSGLSRVLSLRRACRCPGGAHER